jgi:hypothetical protein
MFTALLLAILALLVWWLTTLKLYEPENGQLAVLTKFGKHIKVIAVGVPEEEVEVKDKDGTTILILGLGYSRAPEKDSERNYVLPVVIKASWMLLIWPFGIEIFPYAYKRHKTLKEIRETKGELRWTPETERDATGREIPLSEDTMALGLWKEENKTSLFFREREDARFPFRTGGDGVQGNFSAFLMFFIWNPSAAISAVKDFKADHEKAAIDLFRHWAGKPEREYLRDVQGISFDKIKDADVNAEAFFWDINRENYHVGVFLEDIKLEEPYLYKAGRDVLEQKELATKNLYAQAATEIANKTAIMVADTDAEVTKKRGEAEAKVIAIKGESENKVAQENRLNEVAAEVQKEEKITAIKLDAAGKVIDKAIEYKEKEDVTEVKKWEGAGKTNGTLVIVEGKKNQDNSQFDDLLVGNAISSLIGNKQKQGGTDA